MQADGRRIGYVPHHFCTGGREPDRQGRKMGRDAPSTASPARTALRRPIFNAPASSLYVRRYVRVVNNTNSAAGDEVALKLVEQVKAYYLIPGTIVQVTEEDPSSGLSKIRMAGVTVDLWTLTRFLCKHAVKDTYGV